MKHERLSGALLALLILALAPAIFAHGGEDHGDKKPVAATGTGMIARTARAGDYEVLLKHLGLEPLHEHAARIFVTRYDTNEPVKDAAVKLGITSKEGAPVNVNAKPSSRPGEFDIVLPPLDQGSYNLSVDVTGGGTNGTANYGAVTVEEAKAMATTGSENASGVWGALFWSLGITALAVASLKGFFAWRRRVVLQQEA